MSLKSELKKISFGHGPTTFQFFAYDFALWYRDTHKEHSSEVVLTVIDFLVGRSEDYLQQEYARFILETSE